MVHTYGGPPGNHVVRGPWPARLKPLNGESLSSWLVRTSLANKTTPQKIVNYIWPNWRAWTRDLDRSLTLQQLNALISVSSLTSPSISRMTLKPLIENLLGTSDLHCNTAWKWVIQRGTRNRNTHFSTQYCIECLRKDRIPFLRLSWRLSFMTVCELHGVYLLDACPHCGESVEIHKLQRGKLKYCAHCRWDISDTPSTRSPPELLTMTRSLCAYADDKLKSPPYEFERLNFLLALVRRLSKLTSNLSSPKLFTVLQYLERERVNDIQRVSFDWLPIHDRAYLLNAVTPLFLASDKEIALELLDSPIPQSTFRYMTTSFPSGIARYFPPAAKMEREPGSRSSPQLPQPAPKRLVQRRWRVFLKKHGLI